MLKSKISSSAIAATSAPPQVTAETVSETFRSHGLAPSLISMRGACDLTSLSRTAINRRRAAGLFPQPVELGERRFAFVRSEVEDWIAERIAKSRSPQAPHGRSAPPVSDDLSSAR